MCDMSRPQRWNLSSWTGRRPAGRFIGLAAGRLASVSAAGAGRLLAGRPSAPAGAGRQPGHRSSPARPGRPAQAVPESPAARRRGLGDQEPRRPSTTSRGTPGRAACCRASRSRCSSLAKPPWFTVTAYRLGWYQGDGARQGLALQVAARRRAAGRRRDRQHEHRHDRLGPGDRGAPPTAGPPALPAAAGRRLWRAALRARSRSGRPRPRARSCSRTASRPGRPTTRGAATTCTSARRVATPSGRSRSAWTAVRQQRRGHVPHLRAERHQARRVPVGDRGLPLAYLTSMDIAATRDALAGASALVSMGHDEYWTPGERATVTAARDAGINLAFLGANAMFRRTRLSATPRARPAGDLLQDAYYARIRCTGKDHALVTSDFRAAAAPGPGVLADRDHLRGLPGGRARTW